jgi:hypothetical protein
LEAILLAARPDNVLWTDDLAVAEFIHQEFGTKRVWTQQIVNYLCEKKYITIDTVEDITTQLMQMGYYYTKPTVGTLIKAVDKSMGDINQAPLRQVLNWFSDPKVRFQGKHLIGIMFIKGLWQSEHLESTSQSITIEVLELVSKIPNGRPIIVSWFNSISVIFGIDVVSAAKVKRIIEVWLNRAQGGNIIIP